MTIRRWLLAAATLVIGTFQAWDSGVFSSTPGPRALALVAVATLALAALLARTRGVYLTALLVSAALLLAARLLSPTPLPELLVIGVLGAAGLLTLFGPAGRATPGASGAGPA